MLLILRNRNLATRFQVLVEIAANQPNVPQRDVAKKLGVTSQAVSEHIAKLMAERLITSDGRSKYRVTTEGVNWILKELRGLQSYSDFVKKAVTNITVCAAVAEHDMAQGQAVGLKMKDGLLFATDDLGKGAKGIVVTGAKRGEDVGITSIEGIVDVPRGKITVLKIPGIQRGGSRAVDLDKLRRETRTKALVGSLGIEALVALRRVGVKPAYFHGVTEAAIEAVHSGLPFLLVCTEEELPGLLGRLGAESLDYEVLDLRAVPAP